MVCRFCGLSVRIFNHNCCSENFVLRNTILVYDMPIVFTQDLVKQFLIVVIRLKAAKLGESEPMDLPLLVPQSRIFRDHDLTLKPKMR